MLSLWTKTKICALPKLYSTVELCVQYLVPVVRSLGLKYIWCSSLCVVSGERQRLANGDQDMLARTHTRATHQLAGGKLVRGAVVHVGGPFRNVLDIRNDVLNGTFGGCRQKHAALAG